MLAHLAARLTKKLPCRQFSAPRITITNAPKRAQQKRNDKMDIKKVLADHKRWLADGSGVRADLSNAILIDARLSGADLRDANLSGAMVTMADLRCADLSCADLSGADLRDADLRGAVLDGTDLSNADLTGAIMPEFQGYNVQDRKHKNVRSEVLAEADTLINGDRQKHYGTPQENFAAIAQMWSAYLGTSVSPADVCNLMACLKIARLRNGPHRDSSVDGCGYLALGHELDT